MFCRIAGIFTLCLIFGTLLTFASCFWWFSVHTFGLSFGLVSVLNQFLLYDDDQTQYLLDLHLPKVLLELLEGGDLVEELWLSLFPTLLVQLIVFDD